MLILLHLSVSHMSRLTEVRCAAVQWSRWRLRLCGRRVYIVQGAGRVARGLMCSKRVLGHERFRLNPGIPGNVTSSSFPASRWSLCDIGEGRGRATLTKVLRGKERGRTQHQFIGGSVSNGL